MHRIFLPSLYWIFTATVWNQTTPLDPVAVKTRPVTPLPTVSPPPNPTPPPAAAPTKTAATTIRWRGNEYDVFFANLERDTLSLHWKTPEPGGQNLARLGAVRKAIEKTPGRELLLATNAGMYRPDQSPVGLHLESGRVLVPLDRQTGISGNFYLSPNGVFFLRKDGRAGVLETGAFAAQFPGSDHGGVLELATQSGPLLVRDGELHPAFRENSTSLHIRSGVGVSSGKIVVFAISRQPVNFHSFATLFLDLLRCRDALFLDGAVSLFHAPACGLENPGGNFGGILAVSVGKQ